MKKFMKAIAFATVMCMLLSTVAFANSSADIATAGTVDVIVEGATASTPIAFVVTDTTVTEAANITSTNIKDVAQTETDAEGNVSITLGTGGLDAVNVFYGYQNVGDKAKMLPAALEVEVNETVVVTFLEFINDATIKEAAKSNENIPATDNDKAGAVRATVNVTKAEGKTIKDMIWSFRYKTSEESDTVEYAYAKANDSLFEVLTGDIEIGLAFSNGNESGTVNEVIVTDLEAIVKLVDTEGSEKVIFSDATDEDREKE